jgi:predicted enzyme related to lactoylglutathione lyase
LVTTDTAAGRNFYTGLFGWTAREQAIQPAGVYVLLEKGDRNVVAGIAARRPEQPLHSHWLLFVAVSNVDEAASKARSLGGNMLAAPHDAMPLGRVAILQDPMGAIFGAREDTRHANIRAANDQGALVWTELVAPNANTARDFYSRLFDWGVELRPTTSSPEPYTNFMRGNSQAAGMIQLAPDVMPPQWLPYFGTPDANASTADAERLGASTLVPPSDVAGARFAILEDPQGAPFGVIAAARQR